MDVSAHAWKLTFESPALLDDGPGMTT
jgi:hypothetical protein